MPTPTTVVLFGATGDLAQRKLLPGLLHLFQSGLLTEIQVVGTSLDEHDRDSFIEFARKAIAEYGGEGPDPEGWPEFAKRLHWAPGARRRGGTAYDRRPTPRPVRHRRAAPAALPERPAQGGAAGRAHARRRRAGRAQPDHHGEAVRHRPGVGQASSTAQLHEVFDEEQIFRIDHFLGKEAAQNILAFRFANGLFEPIWHRNHIDHVQIDVPEELGLAQRADFYESTGAYRDMVVTHLFQVLAFIAMEPPTALEPDAISEEKNKVFRSMLPIEPADVVRGQYIGYRDIEGVAPDSETETFIALKCYVDNWRWAGVPFYLRTGKRMAEGARIISIAFREPPRSMFPPGSGVGDHGPDHLTFDLADQSKMSLSFYGKRPGPGMRLDKLSMQFAMHETGWAGAVLEAYERLIYDAVRGDRTLFTTAEGIERLWELSTPLLDNPPVVRPYAQGSWGPNRIHQLIAPHAWRLPFERAWRDPNVVGA